MNRDSTINDKIILEALKRGKADRQGGDLSYIRFREAFRNVERGTVIVGNRVILGYPHIRRIFALKNGVRKNIGDHTVYAEEKIDGFNTRIASIDGKIYGFSRGGYLDLFITEKAREMGLERFFKDFPDCVLCGEMIGNTPYTEPTKSGDVVLYVFDIDLGDGSYMPCDERYKVIRKYGMTGVPVLGRFESSDSAGLRRTILALNKGRKEGMVLKSIDRSVAVKYVTPWSDIEDVAQGSDIWFDMPVGFYYQRVLRSAFFIEEFGLDQKDYATKLGKAFYEGLAKAVRKAGEGKEIDNEFEITIKDARIWDEIKKHMSHDVKVEMLWKRQENGKARIRFRKIYRKTTRLLSAYAGGKSVTD